MESKIKKGKKRVEANWRMDESYVEVEGIWYYLCRAVDKWGNTVDFLLTRGKQRMSAQSFLIKAVNNNCRPIVINIDKSSSNICAIRFYNKRSFSHIKIRQCKYLKIFRIESSFIKWQIQNGLGFKSFESARLKLRGIDVVAMLRKNQILNPDISMFKSFCKLAA